MAAHNEPLVIHLCTADWARIPWDVLEKISMRIVNEVDNVTELCMILPRDHQLRLMGVIIE